MIKKADIILGLVLIVIGLGLTWFFFTLEETGQMVRISVNGQEYGVYSLQEPRTIEIKNGNAINKVTIKDGSAAMTFSNCKGQDCVHRGAISKTSHTIACLPHEILIEITGKDKQYDAIVQ